jgi:hypothetical protein
MDSHTTSTNVVRFRDFTQRPMPLGVTLASAIAVLREIAALSQDHLVTEGPVHPDHRLLALCAEALHISRQAQGFREIRGCELNLGRPLTPEERIHRDVAFDNERALTVCAATLIKRASKIPATSTAGIFAKALL